MIRILQVVNDMHRAGIETMLMNYYRNIDRDKIQFDFLTHRPYKSDYDDEIISLGGKIYRAPRLYPQNYPQYFKWMSEFWKQHSEYKIVHSHIDSMSYLPLLTAKKAGIPVRIAHSHSIAIDMNYKFFLKQLFRLKITSVANYYLACGEEAGRFLFKNQYFLVIPNAVDAKKFYFNKEIRIAKRQELGYDREFVLGHIGRFSQEKNHLFLIKIFFELQKKDSNARLMLVGVGEKEQEIKSEVNKLKIADKVTFLGNRNDANELYQAMDVFILPSMFEGVPLVGIEAQFADLPCFFSDRVSEEVKFNNRSQFLSLALSPKEWAEAIIQQKGIMRNSEHASIVNSSYDIRNAHQILENLYSSLYTNLK